MHESFNISLSLNLRYRQPQFSDGGGEGGGEIGSKGQDWQHTTGFSKIPDLCPATKSQ